MKRDNTMTRRYLADAGLSRGMRVLEIGCGGGEVTELLAELVGPSGAVVAIDRSQDALSLARERMLQQGVGHVRFVCADVAAGLSSLDALDPESFDALAGRRVLMYLPDPAEVLRGLARWLRRGAVVVFEETDANMVPARLSPLPAHDLVMEWLSGTLAAEGAHSAMGFKLPALFVQAGFEFERIRAEAVIQGQGTQHPLSDLLTLMKPRVVAAGIATPADVDDVVARVRAESRDRSCVYVSEMSFCAWAVKP